VLKQIAAESVGAYKHFDLNYIDCPITPGTQIHSQTLVILQRDGQAELAWAMVGHLSTQSRSNPLLEARHKNAASSLRYKSNESTECGVIGRYDICVRT